MTDLRFIAMTTDTARALRAGGPDANGQAPARRVSDGAGIPCRHCLAPVAAGDPYLILAHRPFPAAQPYAETGPIFLHAEDCPRHGEEAGMPAMLRARETWLMRGYGADDWIVYGTGGPVATADLEARAAELLARPDVAYLHLRSAQYNCFQCRIEGG